MEAKMYRLEAYRAPSGRIPFQDWINGLKNPSTRDRLLERLGRVEQGNLGKSKSLGGGLRELIFDFGPGYRIYFSIINGGVVLLLAGSGKNDQGRMIARARRYLAEFTNRTKG